MPEPTERRASERFPVNTDTSCTFLSPVVEDFGAAKIKNISMDGIAVMLTRPVNVGSLLAVSLSNSAQRFTKTVLVRVANVTAANGALVVGGTFDTPLTYNELRALVM
jgi:hypothetical protein